MKQDLTFVIQGPIDSISIDTIDRYLEYGKVIISCWDNKSITKRIEKISGVEHEKYELLEPYLDRITVVKTKYPKDLEKMYNNGAAYYWSKTSFEGLKKVDTEYAIKVRSDHSFPNIDVILKKFKKNPKKLYILNCGSFKNSAIVWGMGSHFTLGRTKILKKAFELMQKICSFGAINQKYKNLLKDNLKEDWSEKPLLNICDTDNKRIHWTCIGETLSTLCFLIALGETPDLKIAAKQTKKHFDITPLKDLKNFKWSQQSCTKNNRVFFEDRSSKEYRGFRGMENDKNFSNPQIANHIDEV